MTRFRFDDEDVVVIIGSGAGGGTRRQRAVPKGVKRRGARGRPPPHARGLRQRRVGCVQADGLARPRARRRARCRIAKDFPNLPAWIVQGRRRHDHALGRRHPAVHGARVQGRDATTAASTAPTCSTGRSPWPTSTPYYDQAENKHRHHPPPRPPAAAGEQQLQGVRQRRRAGRLHVLRHRAATARTPSPYDGRPASIQDGFNFQGDKNSSKWRTLSARSRGRWRPASSTCGPRRHAVQITHDAQRPGRRRRSTSTRDGNLQRQRGPGGLRRRQLDRDAAAAADLAQRRCTRTGWRTPPARSAATTCGTLTGSVYAQLRQAGAHVPRRDDGRASSPTRPATTPRAASPAATTWRRSRWACRSWRPSSSPGAWGRDFTVDHGRLREHGRACGSSARTCRRRPTGSP